MSELKLIDLTEQTFGRLTVISYHSKGKYDHTRWLCKCECGKEKVIFSSALKSGHTKSCGCLNLENVKKSNMKYNKYGSREYNSWASMKRRCTDPNAINYKYYGGRGITYCKRWEKFENFYEDMGPRPEGKSINRIDNDGNYEPKNCKWSTSTEQNNNKGYHGGLRGH